MSYLMLDYHCPACNERFESLELRRDPRATIPHHCGADAQRCLSAVRGRVKLGEVTQGKSDPPPPQVMDTRPLADGMPLKEFKAKRRERAVKERWAQVKKEIG